MRIPNGLPRTSVLITTTGIVAAGLAVLPQQGQAAAPVPTGGGITTLTGQVTVSDVGVKKAKVKLWQADGSGSTRVGKATANGRGYFTLKPDRSLTAKGTLYLTATGGKWTVGDKKRAVPNSVVLATAIGDDRPSLARVNERTTVAAGFAYSQYLAQGKVSGYRKGTNAASQMAGMLVDPVSGKPSQFLTSRPNLGSDTEPTLNTLASIITRCVTAKSANFCDRFLAAVTRTGATQPQSTWDAIAALAQDPNKSKKEIYALQPSKSVLVPRLSKSPKAWLLGLKFQGDGHQLNGPGNVAITKKGNVWIANNYINAKRLKDVCAGDQLFLLKPYAGGKIVGYTGGGISGAGFGISLDPKQNVWVANFGFSGNKCPVDPPANSVSEFTSSGTPISGKKGYRNGPIDAPQGIYSDRNNNIYTASCGNGRLVKYPKGNHKKSTYVGPFMSRLFDLTIDKDGNVWGTANGDPAVYAFDKDGNQLAGSPFTGTGITKPMGVSADAQGYQWVSNSQVLRAPCTPLRELVLPDEPNKVQGSLTRIGPAGSMQEFTGGGLTIAWGSAIDGKGNVWVANFSGKRFSAFCGTLANCRPGKSTGDALSGTKGFRWGGLQRSTGLQIDPAGNLWVTNNWKKFPVQSDPGGNGLVAFVGVAAPIKTPLIGPPVAAKTP